MRNYYNSLDNIPVWNMDKLMNSGDLRYLLKLSENDCDNLDEIKLSETEQKKLIEISEKIFSEFPKIDITIQLLYFFAIESYWKFLNKETTLQTVNTTFSKYINFLDANYESFKFGEEIFEKASDLYNYIKKIADYDDLVSLRLEIFDYESFIATNINKSDLIYEIVSLRDITNQQIDIKKTSFNEFLSIRKYATEKIKNFKNGIKN